MDVNQAMEDSRQLLDQTRKMMGELFESGKAYNNVIILAGYGGVFALLSYRGDLIPPPWSGISAVFLSMSLLVFMVHFLGSAFVMQRAMLVVAEKNLQQARAVVASVGGDTAEHDRYIRNFKRQVWIWIGAFWLSVGLGIGAAAIMLWFFVCSMF